MRTVFILMDSLNRHYLRAYRADAWVQTPNLDRLAARGLTFDNHWAGSLPCMPARREIMTGRYNFLESPWCGLEVYDDAYPQILRDQVGVYTHLTTDHYHYFERQSEGYHTAFHSWELERGQENDPWMPIVNTPERGPLMKRGSRFYWQNRAVLDRENDLSYPTPRTFQRGCEFLRLNKDADNWHLQLEVFDPHEPFNCPQKYLDMYHDTWDPSPANQFDWPQYAPVTEDAAAVEHMRKAYAGTLTMADAWLGRFLDTMDELGLWETTRVILTTDHGHLLGEHGYWAKNYMFDYNRLTHIPLFVAGAGTPSGGRVAGLTATIDLMPTLLDLHGATVPAHVQGRSMKHLIDDQDGGVRAHHDAILYGYFAKDVSFTDGRHTYTRQPTPGSLVYQYSAAPRCPASVLKTAEQGRNYLPRLGDMPLYRIARQSSRHHNAPDHHRLYDLHADPFQEGSGQVSAAVEAPFADRLHDLLRRVEAPACQAARLGF